MDFRVFRDVFWVLALLLAAGLSGLLAHTAVIQAPIPGDPSSAPAWRAVLLADGEKELARRAMFVCGLLLAPLFLWGIGGPKAGHGWRPWEGYSLRRPWWNLLLVGMAFGGLLTATVVLTGELLTPETGSRSILWGWDSSAWVRRIATATVGAIIASIWLMTLINGAAFRTAIKAWGLWPAVVASAFLFGLAHHLMWGLEGILDNFEAAGLWGATIEQFNRWITAPVHGGAWPRVLNSLLLGGMLALIVLRTGTIWLAVGCLAAWWGISDLLAQGYQQRAFDLFLSWDPPQWHENGNWLWGLAPNRMDGAFCLLVLAGMVLALGQNVRSGLLRSRSLEYIP